MLPRRDISEVPANASVRWLIDHLHIPLSKLEGRTVKVTARITVGTVILPIGEVVTFNKKYGKLYQVTTAWGTELRGLFAASLVPTDETRKALGLIQCSIPIWGAAPGGIILKAKAEGETEHAFLGVRMTAGPAHGRTLAQMYKVQALGDKKTKLPIKWYNNEEDALNYRNSKPPKGDACT